MTGVPVDQVRVPGESSRGASITVGLTSIVVLRPQPLRKEATFTNDSLSTMYCNKGDIATVNSGIPLLPGGSIIIKPDATGRIYTGPVSFISLVAALNLCFTEDI